MECVIDILARRKKMTVILSVAKELNLDFNHNLTVDYRFTANAREHPPLLKISTSTSPARPSDAPSPRPSAAPPSN